MKPLLLLAIVFFTCQAQAIDITYSKLVGRWSRDPIEYGSKNGLSSVMAIASSDDWVVASWPIANESNQAYEGAVQVFKAATGAWVRKLSPPSPLVSFGQFGTAIAISGNQAVITAASSSYPLGGVAYVFDLNTGKLLRTLSPADGVMSNNFGRSVTISGQRLIVGAPGDDNSRGAAYVFDLKTGTQMAKLVAPDGAANHQFGRSVAAEGSMVVMGSPGVDASRGAGYLFNLETLTFMRKLQPLASAAGHWVGISMAIDQGKVALGAPNAPQWGRVYVMDVLTGDEHSLIAPVVGVPIGWFLAMKGGLLVTPANAPDTLLSGDCLVFDVNTPSTSPLFTISPPEQVGNLFGVGVAIQGDTVYIGQPGDYARSSNEGTVVAMRNVLRPMPLKKVAAKGDFAPLAGSTSFLSFSEAFINVDGDAGVRSTLSNNDNGTWTELYAGKGLGLGLKSRLSLDTNLFAGSMTDFMLNNASSGVMRISLTGTGVTATNNQAICYTQGYFAGISIRSGTPVAELGGAHVLNFAALGQGTDAAKNTVAASVTLRQGIAGVNAGNDSAILIRNIDAFSNTALRESETAGKTSYTHGQFASRVSHLTLNPVFSSALVGDPISTQGLFRYTSETAKIAVNNTSADGVLGEYSTFLGESGDGGGKVLFRATLKGFGVTTANNEGLWTHVDGLSPVAVMTKGNALPGLPSVRIAKFLQYWMVAQQTMALVQLTGTGVTAANDQALLLFQTTAPVDNTLTVLMREGDLAPGCGTATIGSISRVEVEPFGGQYYVLASLAGAPTTSNQALFRGFSRKVLATVAEQLLRRPALVLRKGQIFDNQPGKVLSIALPSSSVTASGAGATGRGRAIQSTTNVSEATKVVVTISFTNGVVQVMKGIP